MQIHSINSEKKLAGIASSIARHPSSWKNWHVLHIEVCNLGHERYENECLLWVQSILESYLREVEGQAYLCEGPSIHVLCRDTSADVLNLAAEHICTLMLEEDHLLAEYKIHHLYENGESYVNDFFKKYENITHCAHLPADTKRCFATIQVPDENELQESSRLNANIETTVLLVDDDAVTRWMVRNTLKNKCNVITASSANQTFSKFNVVQPDIVFLDIDLPDKSGKDVLKWILTNDPGISVVMFSGHNDLDNISESLEQGASGFIAKPFLKEDFLGYINAHQSQYIR